MAIAQAEHTLAAPGLEPADPGTPADPLVRTEQLQGSLTALQRALPQQVQVPPFRLAPLPWWKVLTMTRRARRSPALRSPVTGRLIAVLTTLLTAALLTGSPAYAEEPFNLPDELVDEAGVLTDDSAVRAAQDRLQAEGGLQLFLVYVDDFSGMDGPSWADETAALSGLGPQDLLVAVAVEDRRWGYSVHEDSGLSDDQVDEVASGHIEPELRDGDWAGAGVAAAEGYLEKANEESATGRVLLIILAAAVGLIAVFFVVRTLLRRRQDRRAAEQQQELREQRAQELGSALVALDNEVASAESELLYAEAEFDPDLTIPFREALETSRSESVQAYRLRSELGDVTTVGSHTEAMTSLDTLAELVQQAGSRLAEHAAAFAELRKLADRAPQRITELTEALDAAEGRLGDLAGLLGARTDLTAGQQEQVQDQVTEARQWLGRARTTLDQARERVDRGDPEDAVMPLKTTEELLARAGQQVDQLSDVDRLVAEWTTLLEEARTSLSADVSDASRLASQDEAISRLAAEATSALGRATDGSADPVDLAEELAEIERRLDAALAGLREAEEVRRKEQEALAAQLRRTRSRLDYLDREVKLERWALSGSQRQEVQEIHDQVAAAESLAASDPARATADLTAATERAARIISAIGALRAARVTDDDAGSGSGWGWGWGGSGGGSWGSSSGSSRRRASSRSSSSSRRSSSRSSSSRSSSSRRSSGSRRSGGGRF